MIVGADGGNSKTEVVVATLEGEPLAYVRGPGSNSHALGAEGSAAVIGSLLERAGLDGAADCGAFFLCGADLPSDIAELAAAVARGGWARRVLVDNDTFALLWTATDRGDAVAVVCGAGINCVGRAADGRTARYPSLGWETGDWGGSEMLGRDVLFHAARAEDGRGEPTALVDVVRAHFGLSVPELGEAVHYRRLPQGRLGELAPAVIAAAEAGDAVARALVGRLAEEVTLLVVRALRDLDLTSADVVLGGGMLRGGLLVDEVVARLSRGTRPVVVTDPPVLGAALAALDEAGAPASARERLRAAFRTGVPVEDVRA